MDDFLDRNQALEPEELDEFYEKAKYMSDDERRVNARQTTGLAWLIDY